MEFTNLQTENILKMAHCVFYHTKNPFPLHVYKMVLAKKQWWGIIINKKKNSVKTKYYKVNTQ